MNDVRRSSSLFALAVLVVIAGVAFTNLSDAVGAPNLVDGTPDPRGFQPKLVDEDTGEPVRFDPCEPIHYVINPALAPPQGMEDMHRAVQMTAEASGLRFVYDGVTDEIPTPLRAAHQPDRYGDRWAPVLFAWSDGLAFAGATAGAEGERPIAVATSLTETNEDGRALYVSGVAVFDASVPGLRSGFGGQTWGQAMLHELGHIVGLDHVADPASVMNPVIGLRAAQWGGGDRAGLWALGIGATCLSTPETP